MSKTIKTITQSVELEITPKQFEDYLRNNAPTEFDKMWSKRCDDCNAPCCFLPMQGFAFAGDKDKKEISKAQHFFGDEFITMNIKYDTWEDNVKAGFNIQLNPIELDVSKGLQICPLAVNGQCLIYENRPKMCREWVCGMKTGVYE